MKKKWAEQLSEINDMYLEEANPFSSEEVLADTNNSSRKTRKKWYRSTAFAASIACVLLLGAAVLFVPYRITAMVLYRIFDPEHYELLTKLDNVVHENSSNNNMNFLLGDATTGSIAASSSPVSYDDVTDNQVDGILEADHIKRSNNCIFYLYDNILYSYSIAQEDSTLLDTYDIWDNKYTHELGADAFTIGECEFYLSTDSTTITVIINYYDSIKTYLRTPWVEIITLDVSDPNNITQMNSIKTTGYYQSSRLVDGNLLLFTKVPKAGNQVNYLDKSTYLPEIITEEGTHYIASDCIAYPDTVTSFTFHAIHMLDAKTLDVKDSFAYLSYADNIYVSGNYIYSSYTYTLDTREKTLISHQDATCVSCLAYDKDGFTYKGDFTVTGYLENQYSMDEHEGILRMVTTLNGFSYVPVQENDETKITNYTEFMNASLYCVDLDNLSVIATVDSFAPVDEDIKSVRFDKEKAYVCTAYTPGLKDPVYVFDLSDLNNITYADTGTIDGYSSSLIQLKNNYLLGIGVGTEKDCLKVEVYKDNLDSIASVCSYTQNHVSYSKKYKSYYVDREHNLFGLAYREEFENEQYYVLLHFCNDQLHEVAKMPLSGNYDYLRSVYVDEYLYTLGKDGTLVVKKVTLD